MSISELLDLGIGELKNMTLKGLRKIANRLGGAANKRLARLRKAGIESPATKGLTDDFRFKRGGKTQNELLANIIESREYLKKKTSSLTGVKEQQKAAREKLSDMGIDIDEETAVDFWKEYGKLEKEYPFINSSKDMKYSVIDAMNDTIQKHKTKSAQTIRKHLRKAVDDLYKTISGEQDNEDIPDFFDNGENT